MGLLRFLMMTVFCLLLVGSNAVMAQLSADKASHIKAQLVAETARPAPGSKATIAFVMTPEKGWHGYWLNPGDAGKPMATRWTAPEGVTVGPLAYPVPQTLVISGLMNHVYEGPYALLAEVRIPASARAGQPLPLKVRADWLACTDSICVPEGADLTLDLTVGDGVRDEAMSARFDGYRAALPRPLGSQAFYMKTSDRLRLAIPFPASAQVDAPYFFRLTEGASSYAAIQNVSRNGDSLIVEIMAAPEAEMPERIEGLLKIGPHVGLAVSAVAGKVPAAGKPLNDAAPKGGEARMILLALMGALLGGLILNIMPCVFPILSLKAISLAKAGGNAADTKREAWAYTAGVVMTCLALGGLLLILRAGGQNIGWAFQLQNPAVILALLLVAWAITLNLAGVFTLSAIDAGDDLTRQGGSHGAFWTGALVAFVATPCTGPFMAAALGAALVLPVAAALAVFAGLGLGLSLPFLGIAYVPAIRRHMPKPGPWMARFQRFLSIPMALTAMALLWLVWRQGGSGGVVIGGALVLLATVMLFVLGRHQQRSGVMLGRFGIAALALLIGGWGLGAKLLPSQLPAQQPAYGDVAFSEAALAKARASGRGVFLYFTADWCLSCKVNEAAAISREEVREEWREAGVTVMVGDWTSGDAAIGRFLESRGRSGIPLYLYYAPGQSNPVELPQILTSDMLKSLVEERD
jgi:thiol:disulfide interchange protein